MLEQKTGEPFHESRLLARARIKISGGKHRENPSCRPWLCRRATDRVEHALNDQGAVGDLSRIRAMIKLLGMVNAASPFTAHSKIIDGCSAVRISLSTLSAMQDGAPGQPWACCHFRMA
jgi:hypothetical protein